MPVFPVVTLAADNMPARQKSCVFLLLSILFCSLEICKSIENDLTVEIEAGDRECFHQHINQGTSFEVEYQV